jgi:hypothetical protein
MKTFKIFQYTIAALLFFSAGILFNSCRKKEHNQPVDNTDKVPEALYGTWKRIDSEVYWEFLRTMKDSIYIMDKSSYGMRLKEKIYAQPGSGTLKIYSLPANYKISNDSLFIMGLTGGPFVFKRIDNSIVNHLNWQKQVKVLDIQQLPFAFLAESFQNYNFACDGDTIFYVNNYNFIVAYNTKTHQYQDSVQKKYSQVNSICKIAPYFYYLDGFKQKIYRSMGLHGKHELIDSFKRNYGEGLLSVDQKTNILYLYNFPEMYARPDGGVMDKMNGLDGMEMEMVTHYKDDEFLILYQGNFCKVKYNGIKSEVVESYDLIPGYDYIGYSGTSGDDTWISAHNIKKDIYELLKISLD